VAARTGGGAEEILRSKNLLERKNPLLERKRTGEECQNSDRQVILKDRKGEEPPSSNLSEKAIDAERGGS